MENIAVSVIIPVYNVEKYIKRCLDSVVNQTLRNIEIIVVNDATPDNSMEIVNNYAVSDKRIKIINKLQNEGLMAARRTGIDQASGEYIAFCDSDDALPLSSIDQLFQLAKKDNADMVVGDLNAILLSGRKKLIKTQLPYGLNNYGLVKAILNGNSSHSLCNKMIRREILSKPEIKTFRNFTNGEDAALLFQVIPFIHNIAQLHESVYNYFHNESSSTQTVFSDEKSRSLLFGKDFVYSIINCHYKNDFDREINKGILSSLRHFGLSKGNFEILKEEFPKIWEEVKLRKAISSSGLFFGTHFFLLSKLKPYRYFYRVFFKNYVKLRIFFKI